MPTVTPADLTTPQVIAPPIQGTQTPKQPIPNEGAPPDGAVPPQPERRSPSPELAALARRERALRQQARAIQAEKQAFQDKQNEIEKRAQDSFKQRLIDNPWDTLIEAGLSPDRATELMINRPKPEDLELKNLRRDLEGLKHAQEESKGLMAKQISDQYNEAKRHMTMEANLLVRSNNEYEPIRAMQATAAIPTLIEDVFQQGLPGKYPKGYIMSVEEAASMVNEHVIEEGVRMAKMRHVAERLNRAAPQPATKPYNETQKPLTLSNRMTASTQTSLSDKERRERAILAYQGKL